jgi:hypothetical protein
MNYTCEHGTAHTLREWQCANRWASRQYPGKFLETAGVGCWIKAWRHRPRSEGKRPAKNR